MTQMLQLWSRKKNMLSIRILDSRISRCLENPQKMQSYDGNRDLNEHVKHVDNMLDYYHTLGVVKYNIFTLNLVEVLMVWFKPFSNGSINLWKDMCDAFTA